MSKQFGQHERLTKKMPQATAPGETPTLISRNGMSRLCSSFESRPSSLEARRKLRLVAASAFISAATFSKKKDFTIKKDHEGAATKRTRLSSTADRNNKRARRERDPGDPKTAGDETRRRKGGAFRPRVEEGGPGTGMEIGGKPPGCINSEGSGRVEARSWN